jgi:hypothetical protein
MRKIWVVLVLIGLITVPSFGLINVKLTADGTIVDGEVQLDYGQTTTVRVWAQGTAAGIYMLGGDIFGTSGVISSTPGSFAWVPQFQVGMPFQIKVGLATSNGGMLSFGSMQTGWATPNPTYGYADYVEVASYTITAGPTPGDGELYFAPRSVSGFKPTETDKQIVMGDTVSVMLHVPEPMTMALLAVGGLLAARRRR